MAATALSDSAPSSGAFVRKPSIFRNFVEEGAKYPPEAGRYVLYVSYACPWASRCLALRALKGLEDAIEVAVVHPGWIATKPDVDDHQGWYFDPSYEGCTVDPVFGARSVRELYDKATPEDQEPTQRFTVPILVDRVTRTVVNNESSEIIRMFDKVFNKVAKNPSVEMYREPHREAIDTMNEANYESINNGVYKCGFARTQEAYDEASLALFARLEEVDAILGKSRYLVTNDAPTEADVRLFVTLVRFDEVYVVHFKCAKKCIREFAHLEGYMRDVYQTLSLAATVNMKHIREHYYGCHRSINTYGILPTPVGVMERLVLPHQREGFAAKQ